MRIGVVLNILDEEYQISVYKGIVQKAQELGVELVCFQQENAHITEDEPISRFPHKEYFDLDGIILITSVITGNAEFVTKADVERVWGKLPVVSVGQKIEGIPSLLVNTEKTMQSLQPALNNLFVQINMAGTNLIDITTQADSAIRTTTDAVNEKIALAENALQTISEGAARTNEIISHIENNPLYSKVLYSSETVDKVNELVQKLNELVSAIDTKGIKILDENGNPIKPFTWKNINILGKTAREKARERAAKGQSIPE